MSVADVAFGVSALLIVSAWGCLLYGASPYARDLTPHRWSLGLLVLAIAVIGIWAR